MVSIRNSFGAVLGTFLVLFSCHIDAMASYLKFTTCLIVIAYIVIKNRVTFGLASGTVGPYTNLQENLAKFGSYD